MKRLTKKQKKLYIETSGDCCPYCGSNKLTVGNSDYQGYKIYQSVVCDDCVKQWQDIFTLTDIEPDKFE